MRASQCFLNRFYGQEHLPFIRWQRNKAKLAVVTLRFLVLCIHEKPNSSCHFKNLYELPHCCYQQCFPYSLPLAFLCHRQPAKPDPRHIPREPSRIFRCQNLRLQLADIEGEQPQDFFWRGSVLFHNDKGPGDSTLRVLTRCLLEKCVQRFAAAIESLPVVRFRK